MAGSSRWTMLTVLHVICLTRLSKTLPDPCYPAGYELIDMHEGRRESNYVPQMNDQLHCDLDVDEDRWVRFVRDDISYQLTNQLCVPINHCGTQGPLWMATSSSHPTALGIELEANVCTNYGLTDVCCSVFGKIVIRLCQGLTGGNFYVYKLSRPPGCYTGYCVDPVSGSCQPNYERDIDNNCTRNKIPVDDMYTPETAPFESITTMLSASHTSTGKEEGDGQATGSDPPIPVIAGVTGAVLLIIIIVLVVLVIYGRIKTAPWCVPWLRKDVANTSRTDEVEMQPTRTYGTPGENATSVNEYEALSTDNPRAREPPPPESTTSPSSANTGQGDNSTTPTGQKPDNSIGLGDDNHPTSRGATPLCVSSPLYTCMTNTDGIVEAEILPDHIYHTIPEVQHGQSIRTTSTEQPDFRATPLCVSSPLYTCMTSTNGIVEAEILPDHIYHTIPEVQHGQSIRTTSTEQPETTKLNAISGENTTADINHGYITIIPSRY